MSEFLVIALLLLVGWSFVGSLGLRGWAVAPLGFIVGTFLSILTGSFLAIAGLPTQPGVILTAVLAVAAVIAVSRAWVPGPGEIFSLAVGLAIALPLVALFRGANLVAYHIDSFRYLVASGLLRSNNYQEASLNLLEKRGLSGPVIHSLAGSYGEEYVRSHSPLLTIAMIALIVWLLTRYVSRSNHLTRWLPAVAASVLLFATNNRMVFNAFYINDHLVFGAAFLVACGSSWLIATKLIEPRPALTASLFLGLSVLVVTRAEGFIAATLAILPLCLCSTVPGNLRMRASQVVGYSTLVWFGYISAVAFSSGGSPSIESLGPAIFGLMLLAASPLLRRLPAEEWGRRLLFAGELALWFVLMAFAVRDPGLLRSSLVATYENQVGGSGSWGLSLVVLGILGALALSLGRQPLLLYLRFPLTAYLPTFFLLPYLTGGAYRVGNGDSLNRMLMQVVPVLILYIAAATLPEPGEAQHASQDGSETVGAT